MAAQAPVKPGKTGDGTMKYSLDQKEWRKDVPTAEDAGEYTLWYKVFGKGDIKDTKPESIKVTIRPRELEVRAEKQVKYVGEADPELTWKCLTRLEKGDRLTGALTRKQGEKAGQYHIKVGTLTAGRNYEIVFKGSWLVIREKPEAAPKP